MEHDPVFPSVTVCPTQDINPLVNIKVKKLMIDFNLTNEEVNGYKINGKLLQLENLTNIIEDYSYGLATSFANKETTSFTWAQKYYVLSAFTF